ncbi:MAG TPA: hypothetical protein VLJ16_06785, partial [Acidobacteriota bacterium]|nr:hypothetical protein [Acidobacteriota bacterium]
SALAPREAAAAPPPAPAPPPDFTPDEMAKLVLLWAKNRRLGAAALAGRWSREVGREIDAAQTARELERLRLTTPPARGKKGGAAT